MQEAEAAEDAGVPANAMMKGGLARVERVVEASISGRSHDAAWETECRADRGL